MPIYKQIITDEEKFLCPISEHINVVTHAEALAILKMDVFSLQKSYISFLHQELIHHAFQRKTMAKHFLLSPNIVAELFTLDEYINNKRYIVNKLVGRHDLNGQRVWDIEPLERQTYRKVLKLLDRKKDGLIFFFNREPNVLNVREPNVSNVSTHQWSFHPDSPAYKSLLEVYGRYALKK